MAKSGDCDHEHKIEITTFDAVLLEYICSDCDELIKLPREIESNKSD